MMLGPRIGQISLNFLALISDTGVNMRECNTKVLSKCTVSFDVLFIIANTGLNYAEVSYIAIDLTLNVMKHFSTIGFERS